MEYNFSNLNEYHDSLSSSSPDEAKEGHLVIDINFLSLSLGRIPLYTVQPVTELNYMKLHYEKKYYLLDMRLKQVHQKLFRKISAVDNFYAITTVFSFRLFAGPYMYLYR